jgi:hypothetical protein
LRRAAIWLGLLCALIVPLVLAAGSPLLAWRQPIYIAAGFAGIIALQMMVLQPLFAAGLLPGVPLDSGRRVHLWVGSTLVAAIVIHVAALWVTSPPDVVDALLLVSPTPFSDWGVMAMWAVFGAALLALLRRALRLGPVAWRVGHMCLVTLAVLGSVLHAMLVDGTMETLSKLALCVLAVAATAVAVSRRRAWSMLRRRRM